MSKEYIQALDDLFGLVAFRGSFEKAQKYFDIIEEALNRLESIDNAKPSKALECLENICKILKEKAVIDVKWVFKEDYNTIKQALLKAQKEHNSTNLLMQELGCKDFAELRKYARCGYEKLKSQEKEVLE